MVVSGGVPVRMLPGNDAQTVNKLSKLWTVVLWLAVI